MRSNFVTITVIFNMYACESKIAFVTGALGVIGRSYTKHLLKNKVKGVALVDVQKNDTAYQQELDLTYGPGKYVYIKADVSNTSELRGAFEKTVQHFGQLDIVINNAGISNENNYELLLNVNLMGVMHGTMMALREYLPKYKKGPGVIVNTSSIAAVVPFSFPVYCLSKHAVAAIGLCFGKSGAKQDIRVLTICPGPTPSPILDEIKNLPCKGRHVAYSTNAEYLGEGLIKIMKEGSSGAVWMFMEGKEPHKVDYSPIQEPACDYILNK